MCRKHMGCLQINLDMYGNSWELISRHNTLREELIRLAKSAGLNPVRGATFFLSDLNRGPVDLLILFASSNNDL